MQHTPLENLQQIEFSSLDNVIEKENTVQFVDAFVDKLELNKLGFTINTVKKEGHLTIAHCFLNRIFYILINVGFIQIGENKANNFYK
jgi:hypothetical protein